MVLPSFNTPPVPRTTAQAERGPSIGGQLDGLIARFDEIERESGTFAAGIIRGAVQGIFNRAGIPVQLKSADERTLEALQTSVAQQQLYEKARTNQVRYTIASLLDAGVATAADLDNPQRLMEIAGKAAEETGNEGFRLSPGDLFLADISQLAADLKSQPEVRAEELSRQAGAVRDEAALIENLTALQEGRTEDRGALKASPAAIRLEQLLGAAERETGKDIAESGILFDDRDTERGAIGVGRAVVKALEEATDVRTEAIGILTQRGGAEVGKDIFAVLRGGSELLDDGSRVLKRGEGERDRAAQRYLGLIGVISGMTGETTDSLFQRMGLEPFSGDEVYAETQAFLGRGG